VESKRLRKRLLFLMLLTMQTPTQAILAKDADKKNTSAKEVSDTG